MPTSSSPAFAHMHIELNLWQCFQSLIKIVALVGPWSRSAYVELFKLYLFIVSIFSRCTAAHIIIIKPAEFKPSTAFHHILSAARESTVMSSSSYVNMPPSQYYVYFAPELLSLRSAGHDWEAEIWGLATLASSIDGPWELTGQGVWWGK